MKEISWKELYKSKRIVPVPFELPTTESNERLCCQEIIRLVPGKRLVAFANFCGKAVVAKLFYGKSSARDAHQDFLGVEALMTSGVLTPKLLYRTTAQNKRVHILIFEQIIAAESLEKIWQNKIDVEACAPLMHAVTIELATQHVLGIVQRDLHLKNFLVSGKQIYTLDGGDIEKFSSPLSKEQSLENLGLFFSQLGVGTDKLLPALFHIYAQTRAWVVKKQDVIKLQKIISLCDGKRWRSYRKKIFRNCSAFTRTKSFTSIGMYDREYESPEFLEFLRRPEMAFADGNTRMLKAGRTCSVAKITINDKTWVVKRYNIKNIWHRLRRCLRETRAVASWRLAQYLRWIGIPTAKPIAFIEKRLIGFRGKSYFIMEYVIGDHAGQYFATHSLEDANFRLAAERVIAVFENLARLCIMHGDLKMTNILIENHWPILIDLDGMYAHASVFGFKRALNKEMQRFMENWRDRPTVAAVFQKLIKEMYGRLEIR